jgi:hypothetical protein
MATQLPKFESELEWQIDRRARIQKLLFDLHQFLDRYSEFPDEADDRWWAQMAWMVDASFSLWRSAFLTDTPRHRKIIYEHMKEFIKKLLEHNSITFADDHRMRALAIGYYNANARYRIERLFKFFPLLLECESVQEVAKLRGDLAKRDQGELWDIYYLARADSFECFQSNWNKVMRPGCLKAGLDSAESRVTVPDGSTG